MKIKSENPITLAEVKDILKQKQKRYEEEEKELWYEQKRALEHAQKSAKLSLKDSKKLIGQLSKLELELTEDNIVKIADLLPETVDDVRAIFAKERFRYNEEEIKKIIEVVDQYR